MYRFVIVHGAWHAGKHLEPTAKCLRNAGHETYTPTLLGNGPDDKRDVTLAAVVDALVADLERRDLRDIVLVGHSYGGMVVTGAADRIPSRIRRLVYWNAFVPNDGEAQRDMLPPQYTALFDSLVEEDGGLMLPYSIWRDAFMNDASAELAAAAYASLNRHPARTMSDPIRLKTQPAEIALPKSYINCSDDTALPHSLPWHPRLSEKLGLFRLVQTPGSHELCFSDPARLARAIEDAGRD